VNERPIILLITDTNADLLSAEFGRYSRDYDVRLARSASEATTTAEQIATTDHPLALMVADTALWAAAYPADPITAVAQFLRHWRQLARTAKALVVAPVTVTPPTTTTCARATRGRSNSWW
jgi:thioredoxin reductase (NADPH)